MTMETETKPPKAEAEDADFNLETLPEPTKPPQKEALSKPRFRKGTIISQAEFEKLKLSPLTRDHLDNQIYSSLSENLWVALEPDPQVPGSYRVVYDSYGGGY